MEETNCNKNMESYNETTNIENNVINKINFEFGDDLKKLHNCSEIKKKLEVEKKKIKNCLLIDSNNAPSKIVTAVKHIEETLDKVRKLSEQHTKLSQSVDMYEENVDKIKSLATDYIDKINILEKATNYLEIIKKIEELSNSLEYAISEKHDKKQVSNYKILSELVNSLSMTKCSHLLMYANETLQYWHNILKEKFVTEYEDIIKQLKWPFIRNTSTSAPTIEQLLNFQILTEYLLEIQIDKEHDLNSSVHKEFEALSLPMVYLIKPLKKRFVYHFMGSKQTNRIDKPEWYFTQILTWITDHQDFIEENIQNVYNRLGFKKISAKIEFMRGLVHLAVEKLHYDLAYSCYDDAILSHCIDEALGFDKELKNNFLYPTTQPGIIEVLTQAQTFIKWINMEKQFTFEKMNMILTSETAFNPIISGDVEESRITECGNSFINLLSTLTERYEMLPQPGHKLQFLQIQLDLVNDFCTHLSKKSEDASDLVLSKLPNILNTINYIKDVLEEWGVTTHFLHLHYYKTQLDGNNDTSNNVFDDCLNAVQNIRDSFFQKLTENIFMEVKAKTMPYRKEKWHTMESIKNVMKPTITPSACPVFQILIAKLHQLQEVLAPPLFEKCWQVLAVKIDQYLYEEIASICIFNEGGALQFSFDVTKNLFPLFGQYSKKPELNFKLLKDACLLLSMPKGLALSIIQSLRNKDDTYSATEVLADVGIFTLNKNEVLSLLSRRTDLD